MVYHSHSPLQSQSQSVVQLVSPAMDPSTGPPQEHLHPNHRNHFAKPLSWFGSGKRRKRRGLYVSHSASPWSSTGLLETAVAAAAAASSSSSSSIHSVTLPIPYSSYSSLAMRVLLQIVRKPQDHHLDEGTMSVHQLNWWSWHTTSGISVSSQTTTTRTTRWQGGILRCRVSILN